MIPQRPPAEFHAETVTVHLSPDKAFAVLTGVNPTQTFAISLTRRMLEVLQDRIAVVLSI